MFCIKMYVFVISANIQVVNLAQPTEGLFIGYDASVAGWGRAIESKCIAGQHTVSVLQDSTQ
jgi:hypothetical protein